MQRLLVNTTLTIICFFIWGFHGAIVAVSIIFGFLLFETLLFSIWGWINPATTDKFWRQKLSKLSDEDPIKDAK